MGNFEVASGWAEALAEAQAGERPRLRATAAPSKPKP